MSSFWKVRLYASIELVITLALVVCVHLLTSWDTIPMLVGAALYQALVAGRLAGEK